MSEKPTTTDPVNAVLNWVLALTTLLGAAAVVILAYVRVMATAGCGDQDCPRPGFGEAGFTLIVYGAPAVAVATIALSFVTARKGNGILVPIGGWVLILLAFVLLLLSSP